MSDDSKPADTLMITAPERTFERSRGCYNCKGWDNGERARTYWHECRIADRQALQAAGAPRLVRYGDQEKSGSDIARELAKRGFGGEDGARIAAEARASMSPDERAAMDKMMEEVVVDDARFQVFDAQLAQGQIGLCMKGPRPKDMGGPEGTFVVFSFLCDRWDACEGASVAAGLGPVDKLPAELWDIADSRAKKV
jgi:hypothetical protein